MMNENGSTAQPYKKRQKITEQTKYYTIIGKEDLLDSEGFPVQNKETEQTLAKQTGVRCLIRIDDKGRFFNPVGIYPQRFSKWLQVSVATFNLYKNFLRTKRALYLIKAEREAI